MTDTTGGGRRRRTGSPCAPTRTSASRRDGGIAKITICRPEVRNAFRPKTLFELIDAF